MSSGGLFTQVFCPFKAILVTWVIKVVLGVLEIRDYKATLHRAMEERRVAMSR